MGTDFESKDSRGWADDLGLGAQALQGLGSAGHFARSSAPKCMEHGGGANPQEDKTSKEKKKEEMLLKKGRNNSRSRLNLMQYGAPWDQNCRGGARHARAEALML